MSRLESRARQAYIATARGVGRGLERMGLASAAPVPRERRVRHWLHTLGHPHDPAHLVELDVPWWTYRAIDAVERWLAPRADARVFEYGSGASTVWLARRSAEVVSVEHDAGFALLTRELVAGAGLSHVRVDAVAPVASLTPRTPSAKPGFDGLDFTDYVHAIDGVDGVFDLVVIDGRAREACLRAALPRLAPGGLVLFDNSRRPRYRRAIDAAVAAGAGELVLRGLTPTLPYPDQTSLLAASPAGVVGLSGG